jgi:hypothetical protein
VASCFEFESPNLGENNNENRLTHRPDILIAKVMKQPHTKIYSHPSPPRTHRDIYTFNQEAIRAVERHEAEERRTRSHSAPPSSAPQIPTLHVFKQVLDESQIDLTMSDEEEEDTVVDSQVGFI